LTHFGSRARSPTTGYITALIVQTGRWDAGMSLIEVGTPDGWRGMAVACNPVCSSQDTLADTISFSVARNPVMLPP
jgi:hypothetical protein